MGADVRSASTPWILEGHTSGGGSVLRIIPFISVIIGNFVVYSTLDTSQPTNQPTIANCFCLNGEWQILLLPGALVDHVEEERLGGKSPVDGTARC